MTCSKVDLNLVQKYDVAGRGTLVPARHEVTDTLIWPDLAGAFSRITAASGLSLYFHIPL